MEKEPLHQRLAALREASRRREEEIRQRMEWVETRQRELWSRRDRQPPASAPALAKPAARPSVRPVEPVRHVQPTRVHEEPRPYETGVPSLAPRPAEVLLAQYRDLLIDIAAAIASAAEHDRAAADPAPALASAEP